MSIALHGSSHSNYYNKAKLALLEKGVPFSEVHADTHSTDEAVLSASPLAKIPFLMSEQGALCESQAILDYIEARWPQPPLLPADPYAAAKVRELTTFIDWHLEIVARQLYGPAFFGAAALSDNRKESIRKQLVQNIAAFQRLAKFSPFVAGDSFTQAVFGEDLLLAGGVDYKPYVKMIGERPAAQKVVADRKAAQAALNRT
jgi:glutathione S-transferase